jgi:hypothetical protein
VPPFRKPDAACRITSVTGAGRPIGESEFNDYGNVLFANLANVKRPRFSSHLHIRHSFGGGQSDVQPKSPSVEAPMRRAAAGSNTGVDASAVDQNETSAV